MELKIDIKRLEEIPYGIELVVTGDINKICWVFRLAGMFKRKGNKILFEDIPVDENINLIANL
jgi:hypothetical protein